MLQREGRRGAWRLLSTAAASTPALGVGALPRLSQQPVLRQLSGSTSPPPNQPGDAGALQQRRRQQQQQQQQRRQSHYSASTSSGRAFSSSATLHSSSGSSTPERGFASQPAFAYDVPQATGEAAEAASQPLAEHDLLGRAHAAATKLKAQALSRLEEVARIEQEDTQGEAPFRERRRTRAPVVDPATRERLRLTRVKEIEEKVSTTELPAWERLSHMFTMREGERDHSCAALAVYRQEVLHGQDPEVLHTAGGGGIVHVPFLRSGMFAAHQGYSLDSELSRKSLQSRLPLPVLPGGDENPLSARTTSALKGLQELMESTRTLGLSEEEASLLETLLPGAMPAMELAEGVGGDASEGTTAEAGPQPAAGPPAPAHALDEDVLAELADWEARQAELAHHQQLKSQTGTSHERRAAARLLLPPVPAAPKADLLEALTAVQGVETSRIISGVDALYRPRVINGACTPHATLPMQPLVPPQDPQAALAEMKEVAQVLVQDLGPLHFAHLVNRAPWVLLLDSNKQGRPQLGCLHLLDMPQEQRAKLVQAFPRILTVDVETGLLALLMYMQALGMSNQQICRCLLGNPRLCQPFKLPALKSVAAFWMGKGMTREDLAHMLAVSPRLIEYNLTTWQLKFDWLADHVGCTVSDVARVPRLSQYSLTSTTGPRVALALSKGITLVPPSERRTAKGRNKSDKKVHSTMSLAKFLQCSEADACERMGVSLEEFASFKAAWQENDFRAWMDQRKVGIERYRGLTGSRQRPTGASTAAAQREQQVRQQRERRQQLQQRWEQQVAQSSSSVCEEQEEYLREQQLLEEQADFCEWPQEEEQADFCKWPQEEEQDAHVQRA